MTVTATANRLEPPSSFTQAAEWLSGLDLQQTVSGEDGRAAGMADLPYPATEAVIGHYPVGDAATLDHAVAAAKAAAAGWGAVAWTERRAAVLRFADLLEADAETLAHIILCESGKPLQKARLEVALTIRFVRTIAGVTLPDRPVVCDGAEVRLTHRPLGVVGAISPWNAPLLLAVVKVATALTAGNAIVLKPSPFSPLVALRFGQLARHVFPAGLCNVVTGGAEVGAALVAHRDVSKISFTGSTATGRAIAAAAADTLKRVTLELGGNDAAIVLNDADLDRVVEVATQSGLANCGAFCAGIKRIYVDRAVHDDLVERFRARIAAITVGDGFDPSVDMGPIQNRPQYERIVAFRADALAAGGTLHDTARAHPPTGLFVAPAVVTGLAHDHRLVREEQFGPLIPILPFDDVTDALQQANDTVFGLGGSVWTRDTALGTALAAKLDVGNAWINKHCAFDAALPMPFARQSGIGVDYGDFGVAEHCQPMLINAQR